MTDDVEGQEAGRGSESDRLRYIADTLTCWNCSGDGVEVYADLSEATCHVCGGWGTPNKNYSQSVVREAVRQLMDEATP